MKKKPEENEAQNQNITPEPEQQTPSISLEDAIGSSTPEPEPQPQPEQATQPMGNEQLLGVVAMFSSMGLPAEDVQRYQAELIANPMLNMFLPMLNLPEALAKYGIGNGGGAMPEWLRLVLGVGLLGFTVYTTRANYTRGLHEQNANIHSSGSNSPRADIQPDGFAHIPSL